MHTISTEFRSVSPLYKRRWGGVFVNPRFRVRRPSRLRRIFSQAKPHGQEQ